MYCPVLSVGCCLLWRCLVCLYVVSDFEMHWMVCSCSEQFVFSLCTVARCFLNVVCPCVCVCLMFIPLHIMCFQCVCIVLQCIDPFHSEIFLLHEGHIYFVCCPGLLSMFPAIVSSVSSIRRAQKAKKPLAHVASTREWPAEKTTGVRRPLGGRTDVAGEKGFPPTPIGPLPCLTDAALSPLAGRCIGSPP